jgi:hypothetical protein
MTRREAQRLALLVAWDELSRSLDTSDEWVRHPETDDELSMEEVKKIKAEARKIVADLEKKANALSKTP